MWRWRQNNATQLMISHIIALPPLLACLPLSSSAFVARSRPRPLPLPPAATAPTASSPPPSSTFAGDDAAAALADVSSGPLLERVDLTLTPLAFGDSISSPSPDILANVDEDHARDVGWARASPLPFEGDAGANDDRGDRASESIRYEAILDATTDRPIAIRTELSTPLLSEDEIRLLRGACQSYWDRPSEGEASEKSRFTYQRKGNSEAHLSDVVQFAQESGSREVTSLVRDFLSKRVYPWIRDAYLSGEPRGDGLELHVYDSLFIRYNATEANMDGDPIEGRRGPGAGQPLHRDLGYVSVNVMLNPQEEFSGGGTFFEDQLRPALLRDEADDSLRPLKPLGPGHAIAHLSSDRHSGAATAAGVRDILVIFLAATEREARPNTNDFPETKAPRWERNARLKAVARKYCSDCCDDTGDQLACRMLHHRAAIDQVPGDGEAWHYLGMALLDYHDYLQGDRIHQGEQMGSGDANGSSSQIECALELAASCLDEAAKLTPCDGRLHNNLGIALERRLEFNVANSMESEEAMELRSKIRSAYRTSITIHSTCEEMGCDVAADYESACLNYGLYLSRLDEFDGAVGVLSRIVTAADAAATEVDAGDLDAAAWARRRVLSDAARLLSFCQNQRDNSG